MTPVLGRALELLAEEVAPRAQEIDASASAARAALCAFADAELLALRRPEAYGGPDLSEDEFRQFQEEAARASGTFAFLQTQHQSAVGLLAKSAPPELCREWLPEMSGSRRVGIAFSQLRRVGVPVLAAQPDGGGFRLNGIAPWVTGRGAFDWFLVAASLPDRRAVFGLVPFCDGESGGGSLRLGPVMRLAAMEAAQTVAAEFTDYLLPQDRVAFTKPDGWIQNNDMVNVTLQGFFALGCARAGLDVVRQAYDRRPQEFLLEAWTRLDREIGACRTSLLAGPDRPMMDKLAARAWVIDLCARCAQAAVIASSGGATDLSHPAQRIYREAMVYSVSAQTGAIMEASMMRLVSRGGPSPSQS